MRVSKPSILLSLCFCMSFFSAKPQLASENDSLNTKNELQVEFKEAYKDKFHIGTALNTRQIMGGEPGAMQVVKQHFNSIVAENCMKSSRIQPEEGEFDFSIADKFVEFGEQNDMHIHGHTLIWHSQAPEWFFLDKDGNTVSREVLIQRMKDHIFTVAGRYKERIHSWDVVNEAILDDGSFRKSKFCMLMRPIQRQSYSTTTTLCLIPKNGKGW
jgi:endo-1,4-beta-xylanase